jgi:hypothetical protein
MKKGPEIRIIGKVDETKKEELRRINLGLLFDHFNSLSREEQIKLRQLEYPKSKEQIALINFANRETCKLMKKFGLKPYDVPVENFHIVPLELFKKAEQNNVVYGFASIAKQGILLNAEHCRDNLLIFGATVLHELFHLKAYFALQIEENGKNSMINIYRQSVHINSPQSFRGSKHSHFDGLHEAIVAEAEKKLMPKLLNRPELAKEKKWLESDEAKKIKSELSKKNNIPEEDIFWIDKEAYDSRLYDAWKVISYPHERAVLNYVCSEIQKEFRDKFKTSEDVYEIFLKAHFTGRLLEIGRLVEKTFGEGSFRILGNMGTDQNSAALCLESLKKARIRQMRKNKK